MPWVENMLKDEKGGGGSIKAAGLFARADGAAWYDKGVGITPKQAKALADGLATPSLFTHADDAKRVSILVGAGDAPHKYMHLKSSTEEGVIARKGPCTLMARLTKKAMVIILTKDGSNPGNIICHHNLGKKLEAKSF